MPHVTILFFYACISPNLKWAVSLVIPDGHIVHTDVRFETFF